MYFRVLLFLAASTLFAADDAQLSLVLRAQSDFERVELAAVPQIQDTTACIQSQAAALPVASGEDLTLLRYRKGYCTLVGATISHNPREFADAAKDFDEAMQAWMARPANGKAQPEPVSSGLRVLAAIARLESGAPVDLAQVRMDISTAVASPSCSSRLMPDNLCRQVLDVGREWLGWIDLKDGFVDQAVRDFSAAPASGWRDWANGRQAFLDRNYKYAATEYGKAVDDWQRIRHEPAPLITDRLSPPPDLKSAYTDLGGAQFLAGDVPAAIASLNRAIQDDPANARAYYLRGMAKEAAGQNEQALADYNMASRTAFANAKNLASGEAHLYRGILLYRRKDYSRAEEEFASALNFDIPASMRADAEAWRHMAAVASGFCDTAREYLERSLERVSPYFPKDEARRLAASCPTAMTAAGTGSSSLK